MMKQNGASIVPNGKRRLGDGKHGMQAPKIVRKQRNVLPSRKRRPKGTRWNDSRTLLP
jgi:hypothetical protein